MAIDIYDEGYIKFSLEMKEGSAPIHSGLQELMEGREILFDKKLIGAYHNGIGYGNVSIRTLENQFIITGSATGNKFPLSTSDYCEVQSFDLAQNSVVAYGPINASSESMTHGAIYETNSAVQCVMHIHSRTLFDRMLGAGHLHTPVEAAFGTPDLAFAIADLVKGEELKGKNRGIFVTAGHDEGIIAYGESIAITLMLLLDLEMA